MTTNEFDNFKNTLAKLNCQIKNIYTINSQIIFIGANYMKYYTPFMIHVSPPAKMHTFEKTIELAETNLNFRTFNQTEYLSGCAIKNLVCASENNLCVKMQNTVINFEIQQFVESLPNPDPQGSENNQDPVEPIKSDEISSEQDLSEYPINNVMLLYNYKDAATIPNVIENDYKTLLEFRDEYFERQAQKLLSLIDAKKLQIKNALYENHAKIFKVQQQIIKTSKLLQNVYELQKKTVDNPDRTRYKVDALINEYQSVLDKLNGQLCVYSSYSIEKINGLNQVLVDLEL